MTRLIKKYKNRRLYDMTLSRYITIGDLRQYVIDNILFKVVDASSNQDISNTYLLQIIVEQESGATQLLSTTLLKQLIRFSEHPSQKQFVAFLEQNIHAFENHDQNNPYINDFSKTMMEWSKQWQDSLNAFKPK